MTADMTGTREPYRRALERLVAVVDAATMSWKDPIPPDAMPGGALHDAKELLAAKRDMTGTLRTEAGDDVLLRRLADIAVMAFGEIATASAYTLYAKALREHVATRLQRAYDYQPFAYDYVRAEARDMTGTSLDELRALAASWEAVADTVMERAMAGDPGMAMGRADTYRNCASALRRVLEGTAE